MALKLSLSTSGKTMVLSVCFVLFIVSFEALFINQWKDLGSLSMFGVYCFSGISNKFLPPNKNVTCPESVLYR